MLCQCNSLSHSVATFNAFTCAIIRLPVTSTQAPPPTKYTESLIGNSCGLLSSWATPGTPLSAHIHPQSHRILQASEYAMKHARIKKS